MLNEIDTNLNGQVEVEEYLQVRVDSTAHFVTAAADRVTAFCSPFLFIVFFF